jgi:hypothetical protein
MCEEAIEKKDSGDWIDIPLHVLFSKHNTNAFRGIVNNDLYAKSYKLGAAARIVQKLREQVVVSDQEVALILVMHDAIVEYVQKKHGEAHEMEFEEPATDDWAMLNGYEDAEKIQVKEAIEK